MSSTKQFVAGLEERDGSGAIVSQFFSYGQKTSGSSCFYEKSGGCENLVGLSDNSGTEITTLNYSPYGSRLLIKGTLLPDFGYAGYYLHQRSGLNLTRFREYNPALGTWISRDPADVAGGINLHGYANNNPISFTDPSGLAARDCCKYTKEKVAELTSKVRPLYLQALLMVSNGTTPFMDAYVNGSENTIVGNRIDRTFKYLVDLDTSLHAVDINIHSNYGGGPDILTDCQDIYWEVTSLGQREAHLAKFNSQSYYGGIYAPSDRTPGIFVYIRVWRVGPIPYWAWPY